MLLTKSSIIILFFLKFCFTLQHYFVSNNTICPQNSICDGSFNFPFAGLISALSQSLIRSHQLQDFSLVLHLVSDSYMINNQNLNALENSYLGVYNYTYQIFERDGNTSTASFFDSVKIKPYPCSNDSSQICQTNARIAINTGNFSFIVAKTMNFENLVWTGQNLPFSEQFPNSPCLNTPDANCCQIQELISNETSNCSLMSFDASTRGVVGNYDFYHGLLVFKYTNSSLNLIGCAFSYIVSVSQNLLKGYLFLIGAFVKNAEKYNSKTSSGKHLDSLNLNILNCSFESNYFINGIVYLSENVNNNSVLTISNSNFSIYNVYKIKDSFRDFNNFMIQISNASLNAEFLFSFNSSNTIYALLSNQIILKNCSLSLVFSTASYDSLSMIKGYMYNEIEVSGFSFVENYDDPNYTSPFELPGIETDLRPFYYPLSYYALFFISNNNNFSLIDCYFQGIVNIGLLDATNSSKILLKNVQLIDIDTIDRYFIQSQFYNTIEFNEVLIQNIISKDSVFFGMNSNNSLFISNLNLNSTLNVCLFYAKDFNTIDISQSFVFNLSAENYASFLKIYDYNIVSFSNSVINMVFGLSTASCFYIYQYSQIFIDNSTIASVWGSEGSVLYMMDYSTALITRSITMNCTAISDTIYLGRTYYNNLTIDNCSFYGISGTIAQVIFIGVVSMNNVYVNGNGAHNTRVLLAFSNSTGYLNNSFVEGCYSDFFNGLVYTSTNFSYVYLLNNTFFNNTMLRGAILGLETESFGDIRNCTFINSTALQFGGAIYMEKNNHLFMSQINFLNSASLSSGGTIYSYYSNQIDITECNFNGSSSNIYGGFIDIEEQSILNIDLSVFLFIQGVKGGFLYSKTSNSITISDISLQNCSGSLGGVLYLVNFNLLELFTSNFTQISVIRSGGIVFSFLNNTVVFENSYFSLIDSSNLAGGFYLDTSNSITLYSCLLEYLSAENSGAIAYTVLLNSIILSNSILLNSSLSYGDGAILFDFGISNTLTTNNCTWNGFSSIYNSFAMNLETNNKIEILENSFYSEVENSFEGFIRANNGNDFKLKLVNITIIKKESSSGTFIILMKNNNISEAESLNINITFNLVVFEISSSSFVNFSNSNFNNLTTNQYFAKLSDQSTLLLTQIKLRFESEETIDCISSKIHMTDCFLLFQTHNRLNSIFLTLQSSEFNAKNSKFINNFKELQLVSATMSDVYFSKDEFRGFFTSLSGSILQGTSMTTLDISNCLFVMNKALKNGAAFSIDVVPHANVYIYRNIFFGNVAFFKGGSFLIESMNSPIHLLESKNADALHVSKTYFITNKALYGGGFCEENFHRTELSENYFKLNKAAETSNSSQRSKGGAVYAKHSGNQTLEFVNNQSVFKSNQANIGGAIYFENFEFLFYEIGQKSMLYQDNMAKYYGSDLASSASQIGFLSSYPDKNTKIMDFQQNFSLENTLSGPSNSCLLYIVTADKFQNIMFNTDDILPISLNDFDLTGAISNLFTLSFTQGFLCFLSFQRNQFPIRVQSDYYINLSHSIIPSSSFLNVSFRQCQLGEKLTKNFACEPCPPEKYSLQKDFQTTPTDCLQCKNLEFSCGGGFNLTPNPGYWRYSNFSTNFMKCPQIQHCLGGIVTLENPLQISNEYSKIFNYMNKVGDTAISLTGFCALGYTGILCNECDDGYGKVNFYTCLKCFENGYTAWITMQILIKFFLIFGSLFISVETSVAIYMGDVKESNIRLTYLIKIFLAHIQILIILFTFVGVTDPFNNIISFSLGFSSNLSEAFNLECLIKYYGWKVNTLYFQFFVSLIYWIPLSLFILGYTTILYYKKRKIYFANLHFPNFSYKSLYLAAFFILLDLCYFDMINISFRLFNCFNVSEDANPENRLLFDYSIRCDTTFHNSVKYASLFIVVIGFGLGFPFFLFTYLFDAYRKDRLNEDSCLLKVNYFYYVYQHKYFFWDVLHILRKYVALAIQILLASQVVIVNTISLQILLLLVLFLLFLQIRLRPYEPKRFDVINRLEQYSLISLTLSIYMLLFYSSLVTDLEFIDLGLEVFFFAIALLANLVFAILWFYIYIPEKKREFGALIERIKKKTFTSMKKIPDIVSSIDKMPNIHQDFPSSKALLETNAEIRPITSLDPVHLEIHLDNSMNNNINDNHVGNIKKEFDFSEFEQIMKINEDYFRWKLFQTNFKRFNEKSIDHSLGNVSLSEIDLFLHKNWQNHKFVHFLFNDKIPHLYDAGEIKVGIEFFDSGSCSLLKKAQITLKKAYEFVNFKSLKFKSTDRNYNIKIFIQIK